MSQFSDSRPHHSTTDPFDDLLNLEDQYYTEGYRLGVADGSRAGRIEGRIFGLEKGFEKYVEMGQLHGRAMVWYSNTTSGHSNDTSKSSSSERLRRHVRRLNDLTDCETLSTENDEDAVSDFDDRLKDAKAKATLISKIVGEIQDDSLPAPEDRAADSKTPDKALRPRKHETGKQTGEMEDFVGVPRVRKNVG